MAWQWGRGVESAPNGNKGPHKSQYRLRALHCLDGTASPSLSQTSQGHLDVFEEGSVMLGDP